MRRIATLLLLIFAVAAESFAQNCESAPLQISSSRKAVKDATTPLALLPSAVAVTVALCQNDREGLHQLGFSSLTAIAGSYLLESLIDKKRPDGRGYDSMPSTHTMAAFSGASYLQRRYGWGWGIPAYAVASFVGFGRVYGKRHDWADVAVGAAIGIGSTYIFTRPRTKGVRLTVVPAVGDDTYGLAMAMRF